MKATKKFEQNNKTELATLILRVSLGLVFLFGGLSKLGQLLDPLAQSAIVAEYLGPAGYVNQFFSDFVFSKGVSPWFFLTSLSSFEVVSGIFLIAGFMVRPLSLLYGFLLWTFVMSLPVVTTPGVSVTVKTYTSPAMLVMIRDIALSGLMFILYNLGSGPMSVDRKLFTKHSMRDEVSWDHLAVLLRLSLAFVFLVGGVFSGMNHIQSFSTASWILIPLAIWIASGEKAKFSGSFVVAVIAWYMITKFNFDKSFLSNLNSVKREFALLGGGLALAILGGGNFFRISGLLKIHKTLSP